MSGQSVTSTRVAAGVFVCLGTIDIVESLLVASCPTLWPDSCVSLPFLVALFVKAGTACFSCFSSIALFFALCSKLLLPMEIFLLWNFITVSINIPASLIMYAFKLLYKDMDVDKYPCIRGAYAIVSLAEGAAMKMGRTFFIARMISAVIISLSQLVLLRRINDLYEKSLRDLIRECEQSFKRVKGTVSIPGTSDSFQSPSISSAISTSRASLPAPSSVTL